MNYSMIRFVVGWVLRLEGLLMLLPVVVSLLYRESQGLVFGICAAVCCLIGFVLSRKKPNNMELYMKDGSVAVALTWVVISIFGCLPFVITAEIPNFVDALFEIVSGFTTTGASILTNVEAMSHISLFWRSFSHWIGGMGVLVFILIIIPVKNGSQMNLMRAESPGPAVSKFVPRVRNTALLLYMIYMMLTMAEIIILLATRMQGFDAVCISLGTAGTGGFGVLNASCATYTALQQWIITIFMIMFGVNFSFYYLILSKKLKEALKMEEVRTYLIVILVCIMLVTINIVNLYGSIWEALRQSAFQVGSIVTTTGFATTDFNMWPTFSKGILVMLMFFGACAGSTGGGFKISRVLILMKTIKKELQSIAHPRMIKRIKLDGQPVEHETLRSTNVFMITYLAIFGISVILVSIDGFSVETNATAVMATLNNIGPGMDIVGPTGCYAGFGIFSKLVLIFDMLAGRLEILPMLVLLMPSTWRRNG